MSDIRCSSQPICWCTSAPQHSLTPTVSQTSAQGPCWEGAMYSTCARREHCLAVTRKQLAVLGAKLSSVQEAAIIHGAPPSLPPLQLQNTTSSSAPAHWLSPGRPLLVPLPAQRSSGNLRDSARPGREPVTVYFAVGDEQEGEGKSSLWLLHLSERLPAKRGTTEGNASLDEAREPVVCQPLFLEAAQ